MKRLIEEVTNEDWKKNLASGVTAAALAFGAPSMADAKPQLTKPYEISVDKVKGVDQGLVAKLQQLAQLAAKEGIQFKVISGYRSPQDQAKIYAQGRTTPGKIVTWKKHSKHNEGKAVDVAVLKNGGITWNGSDYSRLGELGKSLGLTWGGDWKVRDYGHFEVS